ncbi:MAG: 16S rRNA methyltransferase [Infirmifilum sp.]
MHKAFLILGDASLELVPPEIQDHPAVVISARKRKKRPRETILDKSLHYSAMGKLENKEKRGRPDIVHACLLFSHSSLLNRKGMLETLIHTINGKIIEVRPETRIPRNYNRFVGLMEQLLAKGRVPPLGEDYLMRVREGSLQEILYEKKVDEVILLDERGMATTPKELAWELASHERPAFIVGAFAHGEFSSEVRSVADKILSLDSLVFDAWYVTARVIIALEDSIGLWESR